MKQALSGAVLAILICGLYATAQQPHVTTTLPSATVKLNGSGGGGGDITAVDIATTSPLTGGANCTTGACSFTLGLTGGTLSGLTATKLPVATSATAVGDSAITHNSTTGVTTFGGSGPKLVFGTDVLLRYEAAVTALILRNAADSAYADIRVATIYGSVLQGDSYVQAGDTAVMTDDSAGAGIPALILKDGRGIGWPFSYTPDTQINKDTAGQVGIYGAGSTYGQLNVGTIQQSYSKALVDATATDVVQVPVASNSYEGFTMDYTIFATDATDYQVRQGSVPVAVLNVGGTETCVFGTATEAVNASAGTLTVAFDCTAGTNTVMVRANANTSLASTTVFTIQQRINLTSGTAVLVPQ